MESIGMQIFSLVLNFVLTGGIIILATIKISKRKASAEADNAEVGVRKDKVELVDSTVETMIKTVNSLMDQNKELIDRYAFKSDELERAMAEKKQFSQKISELERRVNRMIQTNLKVIKALEQLGIDEQIINQLKDNQQ